MDIETYIRTILVIEAQIEEGRCLTRRLDRLEARWLALRESMVSLRERVADVIEKSHALLRATEARCACQRGKAACADARTVVSQPATPRSGKLLEAVCTT